MGPELARGAALKPEAREATDKVPIDQLAVARTQADIAERIKNAPPPPTAECSNCKGEGRVAYSIPAERIHTIRLTPCPRCRPEASDLADGRLKVGEARKAAAAARARGL